MMSRILASFSVTFFSLIALGPVLMTAWQPLYAFGTSDDKSVGGLPSWFTTTPPVVSRAYVYRQGFVLDKNGKKMFAEYAYDELKNDFNDDNFSDNVNGKFLHTLPQFETDDDSILLLSGSEYLATQKAIKAWKQSLPDGEWYKYQVVTVEDYKNIASDYPEAWRSYLIDPYRSSGSVLVYKPEALVDGLILDKDDGIIVQQSRFNIDELLDISYGDYRSLIVDRYTGKVRYQSKNNIGYRVAYFDPEMSASGSKERIDTNIAQLEKEIGTLNGESGIKDSLLGPIPGVFLTGGAFDGVAGITDEFGFTSVETVSHSCISLDWNSGGEEAEDDEPVVTRVKNIVAEIPYKTFNPAKKGSLHKLYAAHAFDYPCTVLSSFYPTYSLLGVSITTALEGQAAAFARSAEPKINIPVDVSIMTGTFNLYNPDGSVVPIIDDPGFETKKNVEPLTFDDYQEASVSDLNNDGNDDHVSENGSIPAPEGSATDSAPLYGVWFSVPDDAVIGEKNVPYDEEGDMIQPDLVKVATYKQSFDSLGMVEGISVEDLADTDLYVFRESTGQLVMEKKPFVLDGDIRTKGLLWGNQLSGIATKEEVITAYFETRIPGRSGRNTTEIGLFSKTTERYQEWQSGGVLQSNGKWDVEAKWASKSHHIPEDFQSFSETLRKGEPLRVIAINRATGYIGSTRVTAQSGGAESLNFDEKDDNEYTLNESTIGVNIGEIQLYPPNLKINVKRHYTVEHGATQGDEKSHRIGSEGSALHSDQYIIVSSEWVDQDGAPFPPELDGYTGRITSLSGDQELKNGVSNFTIEPGLHTKIIKLKDAKSNGVTHQYIHIVGEDETEMAEFSASANMYNRPEKFVPFRVAVHDAKQTAAFKQSQLELAEQEGIELTGKDNNVYQWPYRPEMMYSVFDLKVTEILRTPEDDEDGEASDPIDITDSKTPVLTASDTELSIVQDLIASEYDPLEYFGPESHLLYSLEGYQQQVNEGEGETYSFTDFGHLGELDSDDYLTLSLLNSQDAGNVLWEFAFETLSVNPQFNNDVTLDLSADEVTGLVYFAFLSPSNDEERKTVFWDVEGADSVSKAQESNSDGVFSTSVDVNPVAGTEFSIRARLSGSDEGTSGASYVVVPGVPATIKTTVSGKAAINELGEIRLEVRVDDQHGNPVEDGTPVSIRSGDLLIEGDTNTINGAVTATIKGGSIAGSQSLTISSGSVEVTESIIVHEIELSINAASEVVLREALDVTITASSSYGALPDFKIGVSAIRGALSSYRQTVSNGQLVFSMPVGEVTGLGRLFVQLGDTIYRHEYTVVDTSEVQLETAVLVTGAGSNGSFIVDGAEFQYRTGTKVSLNGTPGEEAAAKLGDYFNPPVNAELQLSMQREPDNNQVIEELMGIVSTLSGDVTLQTSSFNKYQRGYQFLSDAELSIPYGRLSEIDQLGFVFNFKANDVSEQTQAGLRHLVSYAPSGLLLQWTESNTLRFSLGVDGEVVSVETSPLDSEKWHRVGAHVIDGELVLQVDQSLYRSNDRLNSVPNAVDQPLLVGEGLNGLMAGLQVFDWASEPTLIIDGQTDKTVVYDAQGQTSFTVQVNPLATAQLAQRARLYAQVRPFPYGQTAHASDDCDHQTGPAYDPASLDSFESLLGPAAAMASYLADCKFLPQIKEKVLIITSDASVFRKSLVVTTLPTYTSFYTMAKTSAVALEYGAQCADGIVFGSAENAAAVTCDIISSLLLVGDVRDFAYHSWWLYWDSEDDNGELKFDRAVYVFASLGIAGAGLELATGPAGLAADVLFAGGKAAAKIMRHFPFPLALASHLDRRLDGDYSNLTRVLEVTEASLPLLQLTAIAVLMKDDFADVYRLVANIRTEDIDGLLSYLKAAVTQAVPEDLLASAIEEDRLRWAQVAWAAIDKAYLLSKLDGDKQMQGLFSSLSKAIDRLNEIDLNGAKNGNDRFVDQAIVASLKRLGDGIEAAQKYGPDDPRAINEVIAKVVARDKVLSGLANVYDIGGEALVMKVQKTKVLPSNSDLGGFSRSIGGKEATAAFFGLFSEMSLMRKNGQMTEQAYSDLSKVFNNFGDGRLNIAKGAAEHLAEVTRLPGKYPGKTVVITGVEVRKKIINPKGRNFGERIYDIVYEVDGVVVKKEVKGWNPVNSTTGKITNIQTFMGLSLTAKAISKNSDKERLGQFRKDMIDLILKSVDNGGNVDLDKVDILWTFDGRAKANGLTPGKLADDLIGKMLNDDNLIEEIRLSMAHEGFSGSAEGKALFLKFIEGSEDKSALKDILAKMIEVKGTP